MQSLYIKIITMEEIEEYVTNTMCCWGANGYNRRLFLVYFLAA